MNEKEQAAGLAATPGYRYAQRQGDELHVAGQVPLDAAGKLVAPGDALAQATRCLTNLELLLECHGFTCADIVQLRVYVVGARPRMSAAWQGTRAFFDGEVPPATLLGVTLLGYDEQVVEVDAVIKRTRTDA